MLLWSFYSSWREFALGESSNRSRAVLTIKKTIAGLLARRAAGQVMLDMTGDALKPAEEPDEEALKHAEEPAEEAMKPPAELIAELREELALRRKEVCVLRAEVQALDAAIAAAYEALGAAHEGRGAAECCLVAAEFRNSEFYKPYKPAEPATAEEATAGSSSV
jgi:hypothetical protein